MKSTKHDPRIGAPHTRFAPCAFFRDAVLTKRGDLFLVLRIEGADPECMDKDAVEQLTRRFEQALRILGPGYRVYQYVVKRSDPVICADQSTDTLGLARQRWLESKRPELYEVDLYLVILRERPLTQKMAGFLERLSVRKKLAVDREALGREYELLNVHTNSIATNLESVIKPQRLDKAGTLHFLRRLVNLTAWKAEVYGEVQDYHVDQQMACSSLDAWRTHLQQDEYRLKYLSMVEPPASTSPYLLRGLLALDCNMIICVEWAPQQNDKMHAVIKARRKHHHLASLAWGKEESGALGNASQLKVVDVLDKALEEIEVNENHFGKYAVTVALFHPDMAHLRQACAKVAEIFGSHDSKVVEEDLNLLNCWELMVPGNYDRSKRQVYLLNTCYADLSFLFAPAQGQRHNAHLNRPYLAALETNERTLYYLNLHVQDVAHTLSVGSIGSGKSFGINSMVSGYQQYDPYTVIFDLGGSYRRLTEQYDGGYMHVGKHNDFTVNPFSLPPTQEHLDFQFSFVRVLIERDGYTLSPAERKDLYRTIGDMHKTDSKFRKLETLALTCGRSYAPRLQEWVGAGRLAGFFDHAEDTLSFRRFQTFDFEGLSDRADVLQPMLFYILHRANEIIYSPEEHATAKLVVFDEAWRFFANEVTQAYIREALKTWRKRNAAMILATQSGDDLMRSGLLETVSESCMTRIFLANPGMDNKRYEDAFQLNAKESELIKNLIPKKQFLLKQPGGSKVLNLTVDPESFRVFTNGANSK